MIEVKNKVIVFICLGSWGDFVPIMRLAKELKRFGFSPTLMGYRYFADHAKKNDVDYIGFGDPISYAKIISYKRPKNIFLYNLFHFEECAKIAHKQVYQHLKKEKNSIAAIISLPHCYAGFWAAHDFAIPCFRVWLAPPQATIKKDLRADDKKCLALLRDSIDDLHSELQSNYSMIGATRPYEIFMFPSWFGNFKKDTKTICFKQPADNKIERKFISRKYDLVFTCGTAFPASSIEIHAFNKVCRELKLKGVLIVNHEDNRKLFSFKHLTIMSNANIPDLLKHASIYIHHGGSGSFLDAVDSGKPQIIIPKAFDQFYFASLAKRLNIGQSMDFDKLRNYRNLSKTVKILLTKKNQIKLRLNNLNLRYKSRTNDKDISTFLEILAGLKCK